MSEDNSSPNILTAGIGQSGRWTITATVTEATPECWKIEVEREGSIPFSDFSFSISGPEVVDDVLAFVEQTLGRQQRTSVKIGDREHPSFTSPQLTVGQFGGVPVELYKDGAEDRYFVVIYPGNGVLRFIIVGEELGDFIDALRQLKSEITIA